MIKAAILLMVLTTHAAVTLANNVRTISAAQLVERNGVFYDRLSDRPFTGRVISRYTTGNLRLESFFEDGLKEGTEKSWYEDGSIRRESGYREGERHGEWTSWDTNHRRTFHRRYEDGERIY
jgi:antitoxin component YwqK of YwqJK toxin-antitoxin module